MKKLTLLLIAGIVCTTLPLKTKAQTTIISTIQANNVKAFAASGGLLFNDPALGQGGFEVPKGSGKICIYASTLWLGAVDGGGQIHVAAQTYRQIGNDYKSGPVIPPATRFYPASSEDSLWKITTADYLAAINGTPTKNLTNWPWGYNDASQKFHTLAPFFDKNADQAMDITKGEYPLFKGDEALFFVYNDNTAHGETNGLPLGVEVQGMMYEYQPGSQQGLNTVFVDYTITNGGQNTYHDFLASVWTDFDLGNYADDYIGTDTLRNMYYAYNGTDNDAGPGGYGTHPPAIGVMFIDAPLYATMAYNNDFDPVTGNPTNATQYYGLMKSKFKDGTSLRDNNNKPTRYSFSGNPCANTGWTQGLAGISPGDRRMLGSTRFDTLKPGETKKFTVAYIWAQSAATGAKSSLCKMFDAADSVKTWYNTLSAKSSAVAIHPKIYPNPATDKIFIETDGNLTEIILFDISGRKVLASQTNTLDVSGLAKGIYILRGQTGESYFSQKIVVE